MDSDETMDLVTHLTGCIESAFTQYFDNAEDYPESADELEDDVKRFTADLRLLVEEITAEAVALSANTMHTKLPNTNKLKSRPVF